MCWSGVPHDAAADAVPLVLRLGMLSLLHCALPCCGGDAVEGRGGRPPAGSALPNLVL